MNKGKKGFSLIELLVTIAIVAALAALLLPAIGLVRKNGDRSKTASNLRQVGVALISYAGDHQQMLPEAHGSVPYKTSPGATDEVAWQQQLDPYIGFTGESDQTTGARKVFTAPSSVDYGTKRGLNSFFIGSYAAGYANGSTGSQLVTGGLQLQKVTMPSMHIMAGEMGNKGQFTDDDADKDDYRDNNPAFGSKDPDRIVQILFADGHVAGYKKFDPTQMTVRYEGLKPDGTGYSSSDP